MEDALKLEYEAKNGWSLLDEGARKELTAFCEDYKKFLDDAKTEVEATEVLTAAAKTAGFTDIEEVIAQGGNVCPGTKLYAVNRGKSCAFIVTGKDDPMSGMKMIGAHIDCPRLDLKPRPLYEDSGFVLAKTHYYGGIKKYQWVAMPLALHGVVFSDMGRKKLNVKLGEDENDPVLYITDLLPHLAGGQMGKPASQVIGAEQLNVVTGSVPAYKAPEPAEDEKPEDQECKDKPENGGNDSLKTLILKLINEKYGLKEEDFFRAEFEIVPALKAKDVGLDRGLIGAYGQDDRVCAYTAFRSLLDFEGVPDKTLLVYLSDKEEIGSMGNTGARSCWLENLILELVHLHDAAYGMLELRRSMRNTKFLSADVTAAFDPTFADVSDKLNVAFAGGGIAFEKYTGSGGKYGSSDASAQLVTYIVDCLDQAGVPWQLTEMGKVDVGGGGTIAQFMADLGMDVIDCGVPVLSMHSPYELTSKADVFWTYKAYLAFLRA
ncbi:MAG: aminopeptidase [Clostridia bacterium]|nr:aminopeptidase [Clostridia bacterium]